MGNLKIIGTLVLVFGIITLAGSAMVYNYQMSQDGDVVYKNGNWYELQANPSVVALMTLGMIVGGILAIIGFLVYLGDEKQPTAQKIRPGSYYATMEQPLQQPVQLPTNYCPGCGRSVGPGAAFCEGCGRRLS